MTSKLFSELGLSPELLKAVDKMGFEQASPIQAGAIPLLMEGRDVVGQSQTGSGKTASFGIPAVEKVEVSKRAVQVLILCPTRELAVQVSEEIHKLALYKKGLVALPIYGGQSYDRQISGLKQGAHVVIGTPGRLMDHMRRGTLKLDSLKMVVLDEVDVMLNMGFREDIELILQATPETRQTVFFSATIPRPIQQLIEKFSSNPAQVRIEQTAMTVPTVEQIYFEVDRRYKVELLTRLVDLKDLRFGIIFCNTKSMVDILADQLNARGYSAEGLHGDMNQAQRDRVMNKFRKSGLEFLVATDVAARGIDVDDVQVVFNYDLPYDGEDYVHRIGRTGRKGRSGIAISFAAGREVFQIRNIERYTKTRIQRGRPPSMSEVEEARANVFLDKLKNTLRSGRYKRFDSLVENLLEEGFASTDIASALIHHLQAGDTAPALKASPREEGRPARPPQREENAPRRAEPTPRPKNAAVPSRPVPATAKSASAPIAAKPIPAPVVSKKASKPEPTAPKKKASRATPEGQTRLWMNLGEEMGLTPIDVVNSVVGETGLPGKVVGKVDVRQRHLFVDVASEHAKSIISKLNRTQIKGRKVKVKVA
ncbi:MAG: DEAD/DEAH box helicase [bacterium]